MRGTLAEELAALEARSASEGECLVVPVLGYGEVKYGVGVRLGAHRASYLVHNGPIPDGLVVRHTCDRIGCINPQHLILGTYADNSRDMSERGRNRRGVQHPMVRHTPEQVRDAVAEYLSGGKSQAVVAAKHGVSQTTLGHWVRAEHRRDSGVEGLRQGKGRTALARGGLKPCGTRAGYDRHRRAGEKPCESCNDANNEYLRAYKREWRKKRRLRT